jgi:hypothetical protein
MSLRRLAAMDTLPCGIERNNRIQREALAAIGRDSP